MGRECPHCQRTLGAVNNNRDWQVRVYDKYDSVVEEWVIKNRTENEASNEAEADISSDAHDWSLTEMKESLSSPDADLLWGTLEKKRLGDLTSLHLLNIIMTERQITRDFRSAISRILKSRNVPDFLVDEALDAEVNAS
jgi:hypothetical protein